MKKKLLYISSIPLEKGPGSYLLMYRHLIEKDDYEILEINNSTITEYESSLLLTQVIEKLVKRYFSRTRFTLWIRDYNQLNRYKNPSKKLIQKIKNFAPDAILTVAHGNLFWLASVIAQQLKLPLISIYHDWWPILAKVHTGASQEALQVISWRFQELYKQSNCVFCVCPGMQAELGNHPNAHILYPIPDWKTVPDSPASTTGESKKDFVLTYAGNMTSGYGLLLQSLIKALTPEDGITLKLYGNFQDWPESLIDYSLQNDILHNFIPPESLRTKLASSDALLVTMGFQREPPLFLRTSFPSKLINYFPFAKPIIVWAPSESSVIKFSKDYDLGIVIEDFRPEAVINAVKELAISREKQRTLSLQSLKLYETLFKPEKIHSTFNWEISKLLENSYRNKVLMVERE